MPLYRILKNERRLQAFRSTDLGQRYQERELEDWVEANPQVLVGDEPLLIIGRQVNTPVGVVDLLALDSDGAGVIVELKRAPNQRDVIAQALEYAAWSAGLDGEAIREIADQYLQRKGGGLGFPQAWQQAFGTELESTELNTRQRIIVVIEGENERLSAVTRFLRASGVDISLLEYRYFCTESGDELFSIDKQVSDEDPPPPNAPPAIRPTEDGVLRGWHEDARRVYSLFRDCLIANGLSLKPKKSGISFNKQTRDGLVFICFASASDSEFSIWLRSDSLQLRYDFQAAAQVIRQAVGEDVRVFHSQVWFKLTLPLSQERILEVADTILREVVSRVG